MEELTTFGEPFAVSPTLFHELGVARSSAGREPDEVEQQLDGFLLDPGKGGLAPGLGPPAYLAGDGRVVWTSWPEWSTLWSEWPKFAPCQRDANATLVVGAKMTGIATLTELLPTRPDRADDCLACAGTGWTDLLSFDREPFQIVCAVCGGLGWEIAGEPQGPKTTELLGLLARLYALLRKADIWRWAIWANAVADRLRAGDPSGLELLQNASGGMGTFNDFYLPESSGHSAEFDDLRHAVWMLAREVRRVEELG